MTERMVRIRTDQASLWKQMMTDVAGRSFTSYDRSLHLFFPF